MVGRAGAQASIGEAEKEVKPMLRGRQRERGPAAGPDPAGRPMPGDAPPSPRGSLLARLGRFCFDHRRWVVLAWVLLFGTGIASSGTVTDRLGGEQGSSG